MKNDIQVFLDLNFSFTPLLLQLHKLSRTLKWGLNILVVSYGMSLYWAAFYFIFTSYFCCISVKP